MAEKEERIWIGTTEKKIQLKQMPRQEAINRMAKALFEVDNVLALDIEFEQLEKQKQLAYKVFAEAALNALLSGDK